MMDVECMEYNAIFTLTHGNYNGPFRWFANTGSQHGGTATQNKPWYLVKGLCEIHNDHVGLSVIAIQCAIQIVYQIMEELNQ